MKEQGKRKLLKSNPLSDGTVKKRYKMYKSKKHWVYSALLFLGTGAAVMTSSSVAQADVVTEHSAATAVNAAQADGSAVSAASETNETADNEAAAQTEADTTTTGEEAAQPTAGEAATVEGTEQAATVKFVDEQGTVLYTQEITGQSDTKVEASDFSTAYEEQLAQGYTLIKDDANDTTFDEDAAAAQVFTFVFKAAEPAATPDSDTAADTAKNSETPEASEAPAADPAAQTDTSDAAAAQPADSKQADSTAAENAATPAAAEVPSETAADAAAQPADSAAKAATTSEPKAASTTPAAVDTDAASSSDNKGVDTELQAIQEKLPADAVITIEDSVLTVKLPVDTALTDAQKQILSQYAEANQLSVSVASTAEEVTSPATLTLSGTDAGTTISANLKFVANAGDVITVKIDGADIADSSNPATAAGHFVTVSNVTKATSGVTTAINNSVNSDGSIVDTVTIAGTYSQDFNFQASNQTVYDVDTATTTLKTSTKKIQILVNGVVVDTQNFTVHYTVEPITIISPNYYNEFAIYSTEEGQFRLPAVKTSLTTGYAIGFSADELKKAGAASAEYRVAMPAGFQLNAEATNALTTNESLTITQDTTTGDIVVTYTGLDDGTNRRSNSDDIDVIGAFTDYVAGQAVSVDHENTATIVTKAGKTITSAASKVNTFSYEASRTGSILMTSPSTLDYGYKSTIDIERAASQEDALSFSAGIAGSIADKLTDVEYTWEIPTELATSIKDNVVTIPQVSDAIYEANNTTSFGYTVTYTDGSQETGELLKAKATTITLDSEKVVKSIAYDLGTLESTGFDYSTQVSQSGALFYYVGDSSSISVSSPNIKLSLTDDVKAGDYTFTTTLTGKTPTGEVTTGTDTDTLTILNAGIVAGTANSAVDLGTISIPGQVSTSAGDVLTGTSTYTGTVMRSINKGRTLTDGTTTVTSTGKENPATFLEKPIFYIIAPEQTFIVPSTTSLEKTYPGVEITEYTTDDGRDAYKVDFSNATDKRVTINAAGYVSGYVIYDVANSFSRFQAAPDAVGGTSEAQMYYKTTGQINDITADLADPSNTQDGSRYSNGSMTQGDTKAIKIPLQRNTYTIKNMEGVFGLSMIQGSNDTGYSTSGTINQVADLGDNSYAINVENLTATPLTNVNELVNLPESGDAFGSQFTVQLTGAATTVPTGVTVLYSQTRQAQQTTTGAAIDQTTFVTADQVTDWSTIKSILIHTDTLAANTTLGRVVFSVEDPTQTADLGKTAYFDNGTYADGLTPAIASKASAAKLTVGGTVSVKFAFLLPDGTTRAIPTATQSLIIGKDKLTTPAITGTDIPAGYYVINSSSGLANTTLTGTTSTSTAYKIDSIQNSTTDYTAIGGTNDVAVMNDVAQYYFDGDTVLIPVADSTVQKVNIVYVDDDATDPEKATLLTDVITGTSATKGTYTVKTSTFTAKGYKQVSSDIPTGGIVFDADGDTDQTYTVHYTHTTTNGSMMATAIVKYVVEGGKTTAPKAFAQQINWTTVTDNVTKTVTYTPKVTETNPVDSPELNGYTPDIAKVAAISLAATTTKPDTITTTVTYSPNTQKAAVKFIDDTTSTAEKTTILTTDNLVGDSGTDSTYTTAQEIADFQAAGYVLVSDQTNNKAITFDKDDAADQTYEVHLKHDTVTITPNTPGTPESLIDPKIPNVKWPAGSDKDSLQVTVNEAIDYQYSDKTQAAPTVQKSVVFTRGATVDKVTGGITYTDWSVASGNAAFAQVDSPVIAGYTPSAANVAGFTATPTTADVKQTITYTADTQKATVKYVDETGAEIATAVKITGPSNSTVDESDYHAQTQAVLDKGYNLVSDGANGAKFDADDAKDQEFTIVLTKVAEVNVTTPITPVDKDGNPIPGTTPTDVTGVPGTEIPATEIPNVPGYTPTPGQTPKVPTPTRGDDGKVTTPPTNVIYTPNTQKATVKYVDETGAEIMPSVKLTGLTNTAVNEADYHDQTQAAIAKGYNLVSDGANGAKFDTDDAKDQEFTIVLKKVPTVKVTTPVTPVDKDGNPIPGTTPTDVTGVPGTEIPSEQFPTVPGYTPTPGQTPKIPTPTRGTDGKVTTPPTNVVYTADTQKATVTYIDDTTGQTLAVKELSGASGSTSEYKTATDITAYETKGYELVTDNVAVTGIVFDTDTAKAQNYDVHLKHGFATATALKPGIPGTAIDPKNPLVVWPIGSDRDSLEITYTETVKYQYEDGTTASDDVQRDVIFGSNAQVDKVTGAMTYIKGPLTYSVGSKVDYKNGAVELPEVVSPTIAGYTPDKVSLPELTIDNLKKDTDVTTTIVYKANTQKATVKYVDETGAVIATAVKITGPSNSKVDESDYHAQTQAVLDKGYNLISDGANGAKFDTDDAKDQEFTIVLTKVATVKVTTPVTPVDKEGNPIPGTTPTDVTGVPGTEIPATEIPNVPGYTPTPGQTPKVPTPTRGDDGKVTTPPTNVIYTPNTQKATVKYVDETGAEIMPSVKLTGLTNTAVNEADYHDQTQAALDKGYNLVSDGTNGAKFDADDAKDQEFTIVLKKVPTVNVTTPVTPVDKDGNPIPGTTPTNVTGVPGTEIPSDQFPTVPGYTPTPGQTPKIPTPTRGTDGKVTTPPTNVVYTADTQKATVTYIDDTTGQTLVVKELTGASDSTSEYKTATDITAYETKGYELVTDNVPVAGIVFDTDTTKVQNYDVHLKHGIATATVAEPGIPGAAIDPKNPLIVWPIGSDKDSLRKAYTEIVNYQYEDGTTASASVQRFAVLWNSAQIDKVTGSMTYIKSGASYPGNAKADIVNGIIELPEVVSPTIAGYTPDKASIPELTVANLKKNIDVSTTVVYKANTQKATVKYVDETGAEIMPSVKLTGLTNTAVNEADYHDQTQAALDKGYNLVSDGANGAKFDTDDAKDQEFTIVLTKVAEVNVTTPVTPVDKDGNPIPGTTPTDVTGVPGTEIPSEQFPTVPGYTPTPGQTPKVPTPTRGDDGKVTTPPTNVIYTPNTQKATVKYVDETGVEIMPSVKLTGLTNTAVNEADYHDQTQAALDKGYNLVSDGANGAKFDTDDAKDQEFTIVLTKVAEVNVTTPVTPVDKDGNPIPGTTPTDVTGVPGTEIPDTEIPNVPGYTPTPGQTPKVPTPTRGDDGKVTTPPTNVIYTPNTQKATVKYVDETGVEIMPSVKLTGLTNTAVNEADYHDQTQAALDKGYNLVSDGANGATFDTDDAKDQEFTIVLTKVATVKVTTPVTPVDKDGNPIPGTTPTNVTGVPGTEIPDTEIPTVPGYTPTPGQTPKVPTPTRGDDGKVTTPPTNVIYTPNTQKATVKYVDETGAEIMPSVKLTGLTNTAVNEADYHDQTQAAIDKGYNLVSDGANGAKFDTDDAKDQEFTIVLTKVAEVNVTTPVTPVDKDGNPIPGTTPTDVTDVPGTEIPSDQFPTVPGYTPTPGQTPKVPTPTRGTDGKVTTPPTNVVYTPNTQKATVKYVDENGAEIVSSVEITGLSNGTVNEADLLATIQAVIAKGYTLVSNDTDGATFDADDTKDQEFTITFKKVVKAEKTTPVTPVSQTNTPATPAGTAKITPLVAKSKAAATTTAAAAEETATAQKDQAKTFPKTGEEKSSTLSLVGLIIAGLGVIGFTKKRTTPKRK